MSRFGSRAARLALFAGLGALAVPPVGLVQAQGLAWQPPTFGFAGPTGQSGAPWGWWPVGQPLAASALWVEPVSLSWSFAGSAGGQALRYSLPVPVAPQLGGVWSWIPPVMPAAAPDWTIPTVLNGGTFHAW
ncbi:hypothetical protein [Falsiroseomonas selenitidurans]|uniref:Uncharacterized protein n=1 Tax=Falsiroseomonas selenitidurans TaxID=2716335 RepID=A0ABX1ECA8_9PROT|nr:hypothetical protein [Falsiroseomonas selenitidurans]NKC33398.1 hypothetical protein [Falsiroseomonas selenitidurans]